MPPKSILRGLPLMSKTYCRLNDGTVVQYSAAYPLDSTAKISKQFNCLGTGVIVRVGDKPYNGKTRLKFYITKKRVRKHCKRKNY